MKFLKCQIIIIVIVIHINIEHMLNAILSTLHVVSVGLLVWLTVAKGHINRSVNKLEVYFSLLEKPELILCLCSAKFWGPSSVHAGVRFP